MEIDIAGQRYQVAHEISANRNAWARLRGRTIVISLPSRWPQGERERVAKSLQKRAVRAIERGRWKADMGSRMSFFDGQKVKAVGRDFDISILHAERFGSRLDGERIIVKADNGHPRKDDMVSKMVRKRIVEALMPAIEERVHCFNRMHFCSSISKVSIRDNTSRWGSCSSRGSISLSFRLLFMPEEILDYVIVHELAHTKYRSHGPRFWALVERVVPDHKEKRRWLRENGHDIANKEQKSGEFEEPY